MRFPATAVRLSTLVVFATLLVGGCAASSRQRPLSTTRIPESGDTLQGARKALEGNWSLVSLDVTSPDGRKASIDATGTLVSDAFGNLSIEYRMSPTGQKVLGTVGVTSPNPVITTTGRAVIDIDQKRITYVSEKADAKPFDADLAARRANPFALEHPRYYELGEDGMLTLTTRYDDGKDASVARWKRS
jgi:hypothetical protein